MRILLAIVAFANSAAFFGFIVFCFYHAITELGLIEGFNVFAERWENIAIVSGCIVIGLAFLGAGLSMLSHDPKTGPPTNN